MGNLQEETDWECGSGGSNDEDSDDEEIKAGTERIQRQQQQQAGRREVFPVLAPPEQFQNCLSPSATYEVRTLTPPRRSQSLPSHNWGPRHYGLYMAVPDFLGLLLFM